MAKYCKNTTLSATLNHSSNPPSHLYTVLMLTFIYFGRLTYDKGIDIVLDTFSALAMATGRDSWDSQKKSKTTNATRITTENIAPTIQKSPSRQLHIYGTGPYTPQCIQAAQNHTNITYHGRAKQTAIHETLKTAHYCLAPSRVVETFGKSALESLQFGLPVIGFQKWWLEQFVTNEFAIDSTDSVTSLVSIITNILTQHTLSGSLPDRSHWQKIADNYSQQTWLSKVAAIVAPKKNTQPPSDTLTKTAPQEQNTAIDTLAETDKQPQINQPTILYISDFISKIWGIETFLHESWALLQAHGYRVTLVGSQKQVSFAGLLQTACNLRARHTTRRIANTIQPDIVRYHSLFRKLWWTAILPKKIGQKHIITIHDLWYFHPYPAQLYDEKNIPAFILQAWMQYGKTPLQKMLIFGKFMSFVILQKHLIHTIDTRCVPSAFMVDILHYSRGIPKDHIVVLPHFIS